MISLEERCLNYAKEFPDWPEPIIGRDERIQGIWILGNNYRSKNNYYGEYPPNYLKRVFALFPDIQAKDILHLFSGSLGEEVPGLKFDYRLEIELNGGKIDVRGDAHQLSNYFKSRSFKLIIADPPYSKEDALNYGSPMINRNKVVQECIKILEPNGFLVWLDQVLPMFRKNEVSLKGLIGVVRSTNHRFRCVVIFQKICSGGDLNPHSPT